MIAARAQLGVEPIVFQRGLPGKGIKELGVELIESRLIGRGVRNRPEDTEILREVRGRRRENFIEIGAGRQLVRGDRIGSEVDVYKAQEQLVGIAEIQVKGKGTGVEDLIKGPGDAPGRVDDGVLIGGRNSAKRDDGWDGICNSAGP